MDKQNPTPAKNRILRERPIFDKRTVIELAENQMTEVCGGSGCMTGLPTCKGTSFALV
jgi:hypothetical protein